MKQTAKALCCRPTTAVLLYLQHFSKWPISDCRAWKLPLIHHFEVHAISLPLLWDFPHDWILQGNLPCHENAEQDHVDGSVGYVIVVAAGETHPVAIADGEYVNRDTCYRVIMPRLIKTNPPRELLCPRKTEHIQIVDRLPAFLALLCRQFQIHVPC